MLVNQRHQVGLPTDLIQLPTIGERFCDGDQVNRLAGFGQMVKGFPDPLVADEEKVVRRKELGDIQINFLVDQYRAD